MTKELYAFEPFGTMEDVISGKPIKIMPLGTFYRGDRVLTITAEDLKQIERNTAAGLPRFRIPINENHSGVGKVGTVNAVKFMDAGTDGAGLYATDYELTDEGKRLVAQKRFDSVSPEVIWKKNDGALYQDPQTGKKIDNVLVGLALTDRPFFGHDNVALFSAEPFGGPGSGRYPSGSGGGSDGGGDSGGDNGGAGGGESSSNVAKDASGWGEKSPKELKAEARALSKKSMAHLRTAQDKVSEALGKNFERYKSAKNDSEKESATKEGRDLSAMENTLALAVDMKNFSAAINPEEMSAATVETRDDIKAAIEAYRKDPSETERARIMKRIFELKAQDLIPDKWSDTPMPDMPMEKPKRGNGYTKLRETMKAKFAELMQMLADANDNDIPDGAEEGLPAEATPTHNKGHKVDMPMEGMTTTATGVTFVATVTPSVFTATAPATADSSKKGQGHMADTNTTVTPPAPEFQVSAEEFAALKTKAESAAKLEEQFTALKAQAETFATQLRDTQRARRKDQLMARCEQFMALPVAPADMAEKLQALEEHDAALAKFFDEVLEKMDKQLAQADLFTQKTNARTGTASETFEDAVAKTVREKFNGDMAHYQDAMTIVTKERPELYAEYSNAYAIRR